MKVQRRRFVLAAVGTLLTAPALGQVSNVIVPINTAALSAEPKASSRTTIPEGRRWASTPAAFVGEVSAFLPNRSKVVGAFLNGCNTSPNPAHYMTMAVHTTDQVGNLQGLLGAAPMPPGIGCVPLYLDLTAAGYFVNHENSRLVVLVETLSGDESNNFAGIQMVLDPNQFAYDPVPAFNDVAEDNLFFAHIQMLAEFGVTGGCGGGNYCPNNPVTRGQMAAFLIRLHGTP